MPKTTDEYVAENRARIRQVDRRFIQVADSVERSLSFSRNTVTVDVALEAYERPTGSQIIFGHGDAAHGFGRGTFGDDKGAWSLVTDVEASAEFTKDGREAVVDALAGQAGAVKTGKAGGSTSAAATGDTALGAAHASEPAFSTKDDYQTVRTHTVFPATFPGNPGEFGIFDDGGRLLARVTISKPSLATDVEIKGELVLTFSGDGVGNAVVTTDGEEAIADAMQSIASTARLHEFAFGTGSTDFAKSDSSLTSEEFRKNAGLTRDRDVITAVTRVFKSEPSTQPVDLSEMAVYDNAATPNMIWAVTFRTVSKDDTFGFDADIGFRVV